jgi:uncharacterized hydrophobic protein (TIGR00271 family)
MSSYIDPVIFIYTPASQYLCEKLENHPSERHISFQSFETFINADTAFYLACEHVIISGSTDEIKTLLCFAMKYDFSVGLIPLENQKNLTRYLDLPANSEKAINVALQTNAQPMDIVICNNKIVLFKATIGWIPLMDAATNTSKFTILIDALRRTVGLKLLIFSFLTANKKTIKTAASGCMIIRHYKGSLATRLIPDSGSVRDGALSLFITSPFSLIEYFKFIIRALTPALKLKRLPKSIGYIKSRHIEIEPDKQLDVYIDGEKTTSTPLICETVPEAIRINVGDWLQEENEQAQTAKESIKIDNLPDEKELAKSTQKSIPFFSYASEERFRELFMALRSDASITTSYIILMFLSTFLATVGLFQNSAAVIIGAMLLAPLMAPILSLAMGLLRHDEKLLTFSIQKIILGISIALFASAIFTLLLPHNPITVEMQARISPNILDLAVAILSGIAAAYSRSFKEIVQSLAGVAIAVALVPPLSVAGIGLGRGDLMFFLSAFLLFSTNLIGIILAATLTFRVLGYSPVIRHKLGIQFVSILLIVITIPLYLSYHRIVEEIVYEKELKTERFIVNEKYLIILNANVIRENGKDIVNISILAREILTRQDLNLLKIKIQKYFNTKLPIRTDITYTL